MLRWHRREEYILRILNTPVHQVVARPSKEALKQASKPTRMHPRTPLSLSLSFLSPFHSSSSPPVLVSRSCSSRGGTFGPLCAVLLLCCQCISNAVLPDQDEGRVVQMRHRNCILFGSQHLACLLQLRFHVSWIKDLGSDGGCPLFTDVQERTIWKG